MTGERRTVLVTGATGMVGYCIVSALQARGHRVRALVRSLDKARGLLPAQCELVQGDVTDAATLPPAVAGCSWVFHAAGFPEQWFKDMSIFDRVNADGTANMVTAARAAGVERFIFTSTIDVFTWTPGADYDEQTPIDPNPKHTHYERSKQRADRIVADAVADGLDAVFLHPSGVYGPAPSESAGTNGLIMRVAENRVPVLLPGGYPVVYGPDVGEGHVRAAERGASGARFILSDRYYKLTELEREIASALGINRSPPRVLPRWVAGLVSTVGETWARVSGKPPLLPRGQFVFLQGDSIPVARRASEQLGLSFTPLAEGLRATISWLRSSGRLGSTG